MNSLNDFLEPIKVADTPLGDKYHAFRMDNEQNDMRKHAGLGSCNCCDYFFTRDKNVFLIEETRLSRRVKNIEEEYSYLNPEDKRQFVRKSILWRCRLKVYGTMLVLCRLAAKHSDVSKGISGGKHSFWLVVSSSPSKGEEQFFDNLKSYLTNQLHSLLTPELIDEVEILSPDELKIKLSC